MTPEFDPPENCVEVGNDNVPGEPRYARLGPGSKVGIVSDLHLEFLKRDGVDAVRRLLNECSADVILNAGDTHSGAYARQEFFDSLEKPALHVMGNHDYYGSILTRCCWTGVYGDYKVTGATLWTNFREELLYERAAMENIADFRQILGCSLTDVIHEFDHTLREIFANEPNVVLTHFAPFVESIDPRHLHSVESVALTPYFVNDLRELWRALREKPRLWVHGHTHYTVDYMIGETRVVSNPLGYPSEKRVSEYQVKIVTL